MFANITRPWSPAGLAQYGELAIPVAQVPGDGFEYSFQVQTASRAVIAATYVYRIEPEDLVMQHKTCPYRNQWTDLQEATISGICHDRGLRGTVAQIS